MNSTKSLPFIMHQTRKKPISKALRGPLRSNPSSRRHPRPWPSPPCKASLSWIPILHLKSQLRPTHLSPHSNSDPSFLFLHSRSPSILPPALPWILVFRTRVVELSLMNYTIILTSKACILIFNEVYHDSHFQICILFFNELYHDYLFVEACSMIYYIFH